MGFTWDGAVTDKLNLRQWLYENAQYQLLDFTIIGGQFSLYPTVPFDSDYKVNKKVKPEIKALFTDGNIKDLKVSFSHQKSGSFSGRWCCGARTRRTASHVPVP